MSLEFAGWSVSIKMDGKEICKGFTESTNYEMAIVDAVSEPSFHKATVSDEMVFSKNLVMDFIMSTAMPSGNKPKEPPNLTHAELVAENALLRKELHALKYPVVDINDAKATEIFDVYQQKMNEIRDSYCRKFQFLESRNKEAWRALAAYLLQNYQEK